MRLIDADSLKSYIYCGHLRHPTETCFSEIDVVRMIDKQPTVDAETVRNGRWKGEGDGYADGYPVMDVWYCSVCGYCIDDGTDDPSFLPKYCQNCGAKMDEKEDAHDS